MFVDGVFIGSDRDMELIDWICANEGEIELEVAKENSTHPYNSYIGTFFEHDVKTGWKLREWPVDISADGKCRWCNLKQQCGRMVVMNVFRLNHLYCSFQMNNNVLTNKEKRYRIYRITTWAIHGILGAGNRKPICDCIIDDIHASFPDDSYVGYED